jgi:hypothetical protein
MISNCVFSGPTASAGLLRFVFQACQVLLPRPPVSEYGAIRCTAPNDFGTTGFEYTTSHLGESQI